MNVLVQLRIAPEQALQLRDHSRRLKASMPSLLRALIRVGLGDLGPETYETIREIIEQEEVRRGRPARR